MNKSIDEYYKDYEHDAPGNKYVLKELLRFVPDSCCKILDVGCGSGSKSKHLKGKGNYVIGVDVSALQVVKAKKLLDDVIVCNINDGLPFYSPQFDVVCSSMVLEHIFDFKSALREMNRVLKAGGKVIVEVPNVNYWPNRLLMMAGWDLIWIGVGKHIRAFNKRHLKKSLVSTGFKNVKIVGSILPIPKTALKVHFPYLNRLFPGLSFSLIGIGEK